MQDNDTSISIVPIRIIKAHLEKRKSQQEQIARAQETIENELDDKRERLKILDMELQLQDKCASSEKETLSKDIVDLEQKLERFKDGCRAAGKEIDQLSSYLGAVQRINRGLPKGLIKEI